MSLRALVAGVGNIFLGDDAFGPVVARRLAASGRLPADCRVVDYGVRGFDLALDLCADLDLALIVDCVQRGAAAGTVVLLEPGDGTEEGAQLGGEHGMDLSAVFRHAGRMGCSARRLLIGCEPESLIPAAHEGGLSDVVEAAVGPACDLIVEQLAVHGCRIPEQRA